MSMIPFPEKDLAKLVLGYLAEQQLMTIYDEFLQASPYLDAVKNEYDRIFMTSLRTILAEYRAVKIYLETCKPFSLRKKLGQCANLLEVVKFLIRHVDIERLSESDSFNDTRNSRLHRYVQLNQSICRICQSRKPNKCKCKVPPVHQNLNVSLDVLMEQRNIRDLPGNRSGTVMDSSDGEYYASESLPENYRCEKEEKNSNPYQDQTILSTTVPYETGIPGNVSYSTVPKLYDQSNRLLETSVQVQNVNEVVNVITSESIAGHRMDLQHSNNHQKELEPSETFQELASSVEASGQYTSAINVFTSSPSISRSTVTYCSSSYIQEAASSSFNIPAKTPTNSELLLQIANVENSNAHYVNHINDINKGINITNIKANENNLLTNNNSENVIKPPEQKVEILSNVRLGQKPLVNIASKTPNTSFVKSQSKMPVPVKNVSTSMHTIYVNGTPAYKPETENEVGKTFTKDEIMAMPTIILVPVKGIPSNASNVIPITTITSTTSSTKTEPAAYLPLKIDIDAPDRKHKDNKLSTSKEHKDQFIKKHDHKVAKAIENAHNIDANKIESKEAIVNELSKISTPHAPCDIKKSSSTPRRTSHIRVLDFNTPSQMKESETMKQSDLLLTQSSKPRSLPILETIATEVKKKVACDSETTVTKGKAKTKKSESRHKKENYSMTNIFIPSKTNWDTKLRALAVLSEPQDAQVQSSISKCVKTKKNQEEEKEKNKNTCDRDIRSKVSDKKKNTRKTKSKTSKHKKDNAEESNEEELVQMQTHSIQVPVKPTINIITDRNTVLAPTEKNGKEITIDIQDTPEMDRSTLQTAFGAKLNISDLFETPYKQALYDIQMDTPKFLAPDIPGEPISDVKIMNIPTPTFLSTPRLATTPKLTQTTPGSYVSRPTDYSSGGSYYKPDDQDYVRIVDDNDDIAISGPKLGSDNLLISSKDTETSKTNRALRPVRRCTKNVSYYDSPISTVKKKSITESETVSNHSDLNSIINFSIDNTSIDKNIKATATLTKKTNKKGQFDSLNSDTLKKKSSVSKKKKSPVKKSNTSETNSFIKIKPRRPTPTKLIKAKRKSPVLTQKETRRILPIKRPASKDKSAITASHLAPVPTKSRRKSSTPRKLHCTEELNSDSSSNISPNSNKLAAIEHVSGKNVELCSEDTDTPHLHWSDDGSQDSKRNDLLEIEDITKIKAYIVSTEVNKSNKTDTFEGNNGNESLHVNLVKRGFDIETAKSIERDLLENSPPAHIDDNVDVDNTSPVKSIECGLSGKEINDKEQNKTGTDIIDTGKVTESGSIGSTLMPERNEEELGDCIEFTINECNEESNNYFVIGHKDRNESKSSEISDLPLKIKDSYCMEACMEDGVTIRLKLTACTILFSEEINNECKLNNTLESIDIKEIENAVSSISDMEKLYTPRKDATSIESQCIEILDSALVNIDKSSEIDKEKEVDSKCTEVTLEIEPIIETSSDSTGVTKKRKRNQNEKNPEELSSDSKRNKTETQYLASIQNFDIESVLTKLHGS